VIWLLLIGLFSSFACSIFRFSARWRNCGIWIMLILYLWLLLNCSFNFFHFYL
jgi:hypothetical protein